MKYNRWVDSKVDTTLFLLLEDLTTVLSNRPEFQFAYKYGSYIDLIEQTITGSSFWDVIDPEVRSSGYKTDVFLRTIGTLHESSLPDLKDYFYSAETTKLPKFSIQLVTLMEDLRLEEIIRQNRPGTKKDFRIRVRAMKHYFTTQLATNVTRGYPLDELFCLIYLLFQADEPDPDFSQATDVQLEQLEQIKPLLYDSFSAKNTRDVTAIAPRIVAQLEEQYTDMTNDYVTFPIKHLGTYTESTLFDELTRTDKLGNDDQEDVAEENNDYFDQPFSTWHRENQNSDRKQNFLQFELEVGTKTNLMGGGARETEDGDQAMGTVQGSSGESNKNDYSETEALDKQANDKERSGSGSPYGAENKYAIQIVKDAVTPTAADMERYDQFVKEIDPYRRKLAVTIEKTLEHRRNAPTKDLLIGRLSKNLLPLVIDDNPRVFYKKATESNEVDAVFTLLVDCSASMHNKMEETKRGIVLFHEVLNQLNIPHAIVGFWEDANEGQETYQANYFHNVHGFHDSTHQTDTGAKIMQLEPQEDNRDGFSIRVMTKALAARREKNKFLLVFSDGEPAAMNYDQNGIVDTNVAVAEARKQGIDVIGMFLADGAVDEQEDATMKNIYGKQRLMIPSVAELPAYFAPVLKRLLLKGI